MKKKIEKEVFICNSISTYSIIEEGVILKFSGRQGRIVWDTRWRFKIETDVGSITISANISVKRTVKKRVRKY